MVNEMDDAASKERPRLSRRGCLKLGGLAAAGMAVAAGSGWYAGSVAPRRLEVTTFELRLPNLRPELDGVRIAHLSDLHASDIVGPEWIRHSVDEVNAFEPDVVCLTGDFVYRSADWARGCAAELSRLKAHAGAFAVLGNHDLWNGADKVAIALMRAGIRVLRNEGESVRVREARLRIIGVEDTGLSCLSDDQGWDAMRQEWAVAWNVVSEVLAATPPTEPSLLLVHNPDFMEMMGEQAVDLALAGHTHGGQVVLPFLGPLLLPSCFGDKYASGLVHSPGGPVYVSRGVGLIEPAVRWNCPPEVAVVTLRRG